MSRPTPETTLAKRSKRHPLRFQDRARCRTHASGHLPETSAGSRRAYRGLQGHRRPQFLRQGHPVGGGGCTGQKAAQQPRSQKQRVGAAVLTLERQHQRVIVKRHYRLPLGDPFAKASVSRPWRTTFAPWLANATAISAPMPRELAVTRTTLPFRSVIFPPCSVRRRPWSPPIFAKDHFRVAACDHRDPVARSQGAGGTRRASGVRPDRLALGDFLLSVPRAARFLSIIGAGTEAAHRVGRALGEGKPRRCQQTTDRGCVIATSVTH